MRLKLANRVVNLSKKAKTHWFLKNPKKIRIAKKNGQNKRILPPIKILHLLRTNLRMNILGNLMNYQMPRKLLLQMKTLHLLQKNLRKNLSGNLRNYQMSISRYLKIGLKNPIVKINHKMMNPKVQRIIKIR